LIIEKKMASQIRQNFHENSEAGINKQINMEMYASYVYMSMASYFDRDDVALPGFAKFFKHQSHEEREHAEELIKYQNMRGGRVVFNPIDKPSQQEWGSGLDAMQAALDLEKTVNQSLLDLHKIADGHKDPQMCDFLESKYLEEQVESIKKMGDYITQLKKVGPGLGEWHFDRKLDS
jgi:ferritin heavy chain